MIFQQSFKKIIDFILSLIGLIILSPLFVLIALLIKLGSKGPVFFKQERLGKNGKIFKIWKFRTMIENAENIGLGLASAENDQRITKVGKFLREWTLDEWPQLINVIKGEMSLVGPRPLPKYPNQDVFSDELWQRRLSIKPGLICLVDIKGRASVSWGKRLEYDAWYVDNWSLWLDFKILVFGFFAVLSGKGIYGEGTTLPSFNKRNKKN
jgi:lipopolysaccharide/colanic/teichoic acid biosynthesis glycosyltransferase